MDDILLTEIRDGVATLTLNRPRQMNALSAELRRRFGAALAALGADDSVKVVIITGAGEKAFTAGVDLKELETAPLTADELGPDGPVNTAFRALGKPTIAAVNGFAIPAAWNLRSTATSSSPRPARALPTRTRGWASCRAGACRRSCRA